MATTDIRPTTSVRDRVSPEEWATRVRLAACYRLLAHFGWTELIYTHASARVPGPDDHFLLNPFGFQFEEITASSLVKVDVDGNIVAPTPYHIHKGGFVIHAAVHKARPEVGCVIHNHTRAGMAISMMKRGLLPLSQHAVAFTGRIAYHDHSGIAVDEASEMDEIAKNMGNAAVLILRNHGTLVAGTTISEAFAMLAKLEKAMQAQLDALATGEELTYITPEVAKQIGGFMFHGTIVPDPEHAEYVPLEKGKYAAPSGWMEWPALIRMLDRKDPSYKD
jgi:ribulose-5-phosphate 4-epimerase/fuculose-1-phosphate aldolase